MTTDDHPSMFTSTYVNRTLSGFHLRALPARAYADIPSSWSHLEYPRARPPTRHGAHQPLTHAHSHVRTQDVGYASTVSDASRYCGYCASFGTATPLPACTSCLGPICTSTHPHTARRAHPHTPDANPGRHSVRANDYEDIQHAWADRHRHHTSLSGNSRYVVENNQRRLCMCPAHIRSRQQDAARNASSAQARARQPRIHMLHAPVPQLDASFSQVAHMRPRTRHTYPRTPASSAPSHSTTHSVSQPPNSSQCVLLLSEVIQLGIAQDVAVNDPPIGVPCAMTHSNLMHARPLRVSHHTHHSVESRVQDAHSAASILVEIQRSVPVFQGIRSMVHAAFHSPA